MSKNQSPLSRPLNTSCFGTVLTAVATRFLTGTQADRTPAMKRIISLVTQPVSLLIMGCTLMFGFPTWVGMIGLVIGALGLFIPDWWAASRPRKR